MMAEKSVGSILKINLASESSSVMPPVMTVCGKGDQMQNCARMDGNGMDAHARRNSSGVRAREKGSEGADFKRLVSRPVCRGEEGGSGEDQRLLRTLIKILYML